MESDISRRRVLQILEVGGITIALSGCTELGLDGQESEPTPTPDTTPEPTPMPNNQEPIQRGRFTVEINGEDVPGWRKASIPGSHTDEEVYEEDGETKKIWGQTTYDDLEMERGVLPGDTRIVDWRDAIVMGKADEGRKEIAIVLEDEDGRPQIRWEFSSAWVKDYDPPELDASADGDMATESVTVAFDEMIRTEV